MQEENVESENVERVRRWLDTQGATGPEIPESSQAEVHNKSRHLLGPYHHRRTTLQEGQGDGSVPLVHSLLVHACAALKDLVLEEQPMSQQELSGTGN